MLHGSCMTHMHLLVFIWNCVCACHARIGGVQV